MTARIGEGGAGWVALDPTGVGAGRGLRWKSPHTQPPVPASPRHSKRCLSHPAEERGIHHEAQFKQVALSAFHQPRSSSLPQCVGVRHDCIARGQQSYERLSLDGPWIEWRVGFRR